MRAHSLQMASNEKPNMSESLGGNDLTYRLFRMTSGWSMTLKMEPKLIKMQVFYEKRIIDVRPLPLYGLISTPKHVTKSLESCLLANFSRLLPLGLCEFGYRYEAVQRKWSRNNDMFFIKKTAF